MLSLFQVLLGPVIADEVLKGKAYRSYTHTKVRDVETDIRFLETVVDDYIKKSTEFFEAVAGPRVPRPDAAVPAAPAA